jgi:O-antigen ligase
MYQLLIRYVCFLKQLFQKQPLVVILYPALFLMLFLGDGKQTVIDTIGAGVVLGLLLFSKLYLKKTHDLPPKILYSWGAFLIYIIILTFFSDDIGYSIYTTSRYVVGFLIFYIYFCYTSKNTIKVFTEGLLWFSLFSLVTAIIFTFIPRLQNILPQTNLLYPAYGHNHVVDILLFGYGVALIGSLQTKAIKYKIFLAIFILGSFFSLARAAMVLLVAATSPVFLFQIIKKRFFGRYILLTATLVLLLAGATLLYKDVFQNKANIHNPNQESIYTSRLEYWRQAVEAIKERPVFGSGPGTFYLQSKRLQSKPNSYSWFAHNFILEQFVETGLVGMIFLGILIYFLFEPAGARWPSYIKRNISLILPVVLVLIYSNFDFILNYYIVWVLLWVGMALLAGSVDFNKNKTNKTSKWVIFFTIINCGFYGFGILRFVFPVPQIDMFVDNRVVTLLEKNPKTKLLSTIIKLHPNNPEVLFQVGLYEKALVWDSLNTRYFYQYSLSTIKNTKNELAFRDLLKKTQSLYPLESQLVQKLILNPNTIDKYYSADLIKSAGDQGSVGEYLSKIYYLLGLEMIKTNPNNALVFWMLARNISPGWGHFHVELASLEQYVFSDQNKAKAVLVDCVKYESAAKQCVGSMEGLERPGSQKNKIQIIPLVNSKQ